MSSETDFLGDTVPMHVRTHVRQPERRQISRRWLASTVLVGAISFLMMGGALYAALDGQEQLTVPAVAYKQEDGSNNFALARKGNHPGLAKRAIKKEDSKLMMVSTVTKVGNNNVVKERPFMAIKAPMALAPPTVEDFPPFNPLAVFSESGEVETIAASSDLMYGADVEGEVTLNVIDFPAELEVAEVPKARMAAEVHQQVRNAAHNLENGGAYVSSLVFFDADRFSQESNPFLTSGDITITAENVSVIEKLADNDPAMARYEERSIKVRSEATISEILLAEGIAETQVEDLVRVYSSDLGEDKFREGDTLETWMKVENSGTENEIRTIEMASLFRGPSHIFSIARTDQGGHVYAPQPETPEEILRETAKKEALPTGNLPTIYTGIYRAAIDEGLSMELAGSLVKIFAFDVDFRSRLKPSDELEVFVSIEEGQTKPTEASEILYAAIELDGVKRRYYRFRDEETGRVDYYDETGKSAKKFLLRKPVPNGRFRSGFGMRRHPISKRYKLHGGVDWAAPRGTPIIAAGNGVVEKAGWSGGYGKQTIIRHANGYKTSYSHQTAIKRGVKPGARVRQGQIIGYVGSTGYSTGPHLHYEVLVNNNRVNPMRIRLPRGKVLKDAELAAFEAERDRIDTLLNADEEFEVASN